MRYPALEYQPGIAAEQLSPLAPPREPRHPKPTPNAHTGRRHSTRPLTTRPPYQPDALAQLLRQVASSAGLRVASVPEDVDRSIGGEMPPDDPQCLLRLKPE